MSLIYVDVDTQIDFLFPAGALYAPGAERIIPAIARLNRHASLSGIPLISTVDAHSENDPEFAAWPPHCVVGAVGQNKPAALLVEGQQFVEKQHVNCFTAPRMDALLRETGATEALVYGVVTEICVRNAAFGLLERGIKVAIVTDAVKELSKQNAEEMFQAFRAAGGSLASSASIAPGG